MISFFQLQEYPMDSPRIRFHRRNRIHTRLSAKNRTQRLTRRNTGRFRRGALSPPSERSARSPTSPGRVSERRTLPLLSLGRVYARRTQRASEQRCAYACRCSEAPQPRWAAHTYAVNTSIFPAEFFSHSQKAGKKSHSLMFRIHVFDRTA